MPADWTIAPNDRLDGPYWDDCNPNPPCVECRCEDAEVYQKDSEGDLRHVCPYCAEYLRIERSKR